MTPDRLVERLRQTFLAELAEQLQLMESELLALEQGNGDDAERLRTLFRVAHTLKGAARVAGVPLVERACHALETRLADARDGRRPLGADDFPLLLRGVDALREAGEQVRAGAEPAGGALAELVSRLDRGAGVPPPPTPPVAEEAHVEAAGAERPEELPHRRAEDASEPPAVRADTPVRVDAERLDRLLAAAGELQVTVARAGEARATIRRLADDAQLLARRWPHEAARLRKALAHRGASEKELRAFDAAGEALREQARALARLHQAAMLDMDQQERVSDEVAEQVRGLRMRPFAEVVEALPRVVRDLEAGTGKRVELVITGSEVEADRAVLDGVRDAVLHLVRNAVDHGLEPPEERRRLGKPERGRVTVGAALRGGQLVVTVSDDGRGLDREAVRAALAARGLPVPDDDRELAETLFEPGFSTRREATTISGRGVGLDVVRAVMTRLRGTVQLRWTPGAGTTFRLESPVTLATLRVVLMETGGVIVAVPTRAVERLLRVAPAEVRELEGRPVLAREGDAPLPLVELATLLGPPLVAAPAGERRPVAVLSVGTRRLAVVVDAFVDEEEIVVRPVEHPGRRPLPHVTGAAMLADGRVALVLNPAVLVTAGLGRHRAGTGGGAPVAPPRVARPRILVVDDSVTTRTLEETVLTGAGFEVMTAVDGVDAWAQLREHGADLVLTDLEMPRMDGFALTEAIRASARFAQLPVVLLTSLESPEQRARGMEAGADAYVVKSAFDQEALLTLVRQLLAREGG